MEIYVFFLSLKMLKSVHSISQCIWSNLSTITLVYLLMKINTCYNSSSSEKHVGAEICMSSNSWNVRYLINVNSRNMKYNKECTPTHFHKEPTGMHHQYIWHFMYSETLLSNGHGLIAAGMGVTVQNEMFVTIVISTITMMSRNLFGAWLRVQWKVIKSQIFFLEASNNFR